MSRTNARSSSAKTVGRPFILCALTLAFSALTTTASFAEDGGSKPSVRPRWQSVAQKQAKKRAAASLLGAPMAARYDNSQPRSASRESAPSIAPSIRSGRTVRARELLKEGSRHHSEGNLQDAERCFREAVVLDPRNADCFYNLGALAEGRGDILDALTQYRAGLNLLPKDNALEEAVEAMEARLASGDSRQMAQRRPDSFNYPARMFSAQSDDPPVLGVRQLDTPVLEQSDDGPPLLPLDSNRPFQLHSSQNAAMGNTGYGALNSNVATGSFRPPVVGVQQPAFRRRGGAAFSTILNVGLSTALRGSGLHCPACRFLRF